MSPDILSPTAQDITRAVGEEIARIRARYNVGWNDDDLRLTINPAMADILKADAEEFYRYWHASPIDTWRGLRWTVDSRVPIFEISVVLR
jgi:hypothetical protein